MEIEARFPAIRASQSFDARVGESSAPPPALAESGSEFYISPVLRFDSRSLTVIFQIRDSRSGDVVRQFPPDVVVERYRQDPTLKPFALPRADDDTDPLAPLHTVPELDGTAPPVEAELSPAGSASAPVDLVA